MNNICLKGKNILTLTFLSLASGMPVSFSFFDLYIDLSKIVCYCKQTFVIKFIVIIIFILDHDNCLSCIEQGSLKTDKIFCLNFYLKFIFDNTVTNFISKNIMQITMN